MNRLRTRLRASIADGPLVLLDFISGGLDPRITFSRGSNATLVDSTGKITYAPANLLLYSQEFDNAAWQTLRGSISANVTTAPDGTSTADRFTEDNTTNTRSTGETVTIISGTTYTYSAYLKNVDRRYVSLLLMDTATGLNGFLATFDLQSGSATTQVRGTGTVATATIVSVGNGWYRCAVTGTVPSASAIAAISPATTATPAQSSYGRESYLGNGTSSFFLWGAQLEPVTYQTTPSTYVATTSAAYYGPRFDYDPVTLAPKGLLIEEARTNLLVRSQEFDNASWTKGDATVTANATTSPDGTANADKLAETTANAPHYALQAATVTATAHTASIFVKAAERTWCIFEMAGTPFGCGAWFNLSTGVVGTQFGSPSTVAITAAGNGWWRITMTKTAASAASASIVVYAATGDNVSTYAGTAGSGVFIYGAQLEAGAFATSYIPTVASTVTRSADVATMTGTNFSSWYNQSEGTFVAGFDMAGGSAAFANNRAILVARESATSSHNIYNGSGQVTGWTVVSGVDQAFLTTGALAADTATNMAYAYKANDFAASHNGGTVATDTSGTLPVPTTLGIGSNSAGSLFLSGHIRAIAYYNTRLLNSQLQTLTAPSLGTTLSLSFTNQAYTVGV